MKALRRVAAVMLMFAATATGRAEVPRPGMPDNATFRTRTDVVALNVTVTNRQDKHVPGLQADQFVVIEDGVRQPVEFFAAGSVPLDLSILIDASGSIKGKMALARDAATGLVRSLRPGDRASLVEFRDAVRIRQPLTTDTHAVETALAQIEPRGSTSMYDALYIALKELARAEHAPQEVRRQAIVLLSDGDDTASLISYEDVSDLARRAGILIYSASVRSAAEVAREKLANGGRTFDSEGEYCLKALAQDTGGRAFFPQAPSELKGIYDRIAEELASQYALGYVPTNERRDGAWRRVAVQVLAGDARPRTRTGYFAFGDRTPAAAAAAQR